MTEGEARKILLVSRAPLSRAGVGTIFLKGLLEQYPAGRLLYATWSEPADAAWPPGLEAIPRRGVRGVPEYGITFAGRHVRRHTRWLHSRYARATHLRRTIAELVRFGRAQEIEALWVTLAGPTEIQLAVPVARALGVPLLTLVWDPPEHFIPMFWGLGGRALAEVLDDFALAVRSSERCGVASDAMKEEYERRFGTPCVTLIHGFPRAEWHSPREEPVDPRRLVIGFAGSIYAKTEWAALLRALADCGWVIGGREVTLRVLSASFDVETQEPARIEYLGWRRQEEALQLLSECDICYVPYWFDPAYREATRLCFPNKIPTYLAAGRPIFFHGPESSSPDRFLAEYAIGVACHSLEPGEIVATLSRFAADQSLDGHFAEDARRALSERLNEENFFESFAELVGIAPSQLGHRRI